MASSNATTNQQSKQGEKRYRSIFDVPPGFFDSCRILQSPSSIPVFEPLEDLTISSIKNLEQEEEAKEEEESTSSKNNIALQRWSCSTCKAEFDSLQDQRSHFKSDFHRFNIKLSIAGKDTVEEEDFDALTSDSLSKDYDDISSISGSEDEDDKKIHLSNDVHRGLSGSVKNKVFINLQTRERVSVWKCLVLDESENISFENDKSIATDNGGCMPCLTEREVIAKLKYLVHEPRDNTRLRVVLLARGGHFAGCVFDGSSVVAHKTFHRYVIRAKAGRKQSSKDASGKTVHSAGASLRRYNELALKKEIQELLASWKPYFDASSCIFIHAPSNNRQLFFNGEKPHFSCQHRVVQNVPSTVRRPTLKEARRIYTLLTQISYEVDEEIAPNVNEDSLLSASIVSNGYPGSSKEDMGDNLRSKEMAQACSSVKNCDNISTCSESECEITGTSTPLHEAAKSSNAQRVFDLLEEGMDPCTKDERGRTPYMLATEKEVRNTFRRFMASNLDKWDWHAAKVPSALTKEMEESHAAKQAEKDSKKKAKAKELKKLRKAREKAQAAQSQKASSISENSGATSISALKGQSQSSVASQLSKEDELKRAQDAEREKRATAAERRIAAGAAPKAQGGAATSSSQPKGVVTTDINCSCCSTSLLGKVPFHRYSYKYCSTSCMHVHREILEDG